ncbi:MAG: ABC transporter ATP-binding protein [Candidatus Bathyarchaeia archaeon]
MKMIRLQNVWKSYSTSQILKGLNLTVNHGEFISVRGKSGVGKTTLLKIIGLLEPPDRGDVEIEGADTKILSDEEKARLRLKTIGFIFQFFNLIPSLTVLENIELPLALAGSKKQERRKKAQELLKYFEMESLAQRFPETLSGGERQRVAVIRALANNPKIILADEPTSSLDKENTELLNQLLKRINTENKTTIIITTTDLYEKLPTNKNHILIDGQLRELL